MSGGRAPKAKGSAFEIAVCKLLSMWVSGGHNEDLFWRASISGGRATQRHARGLGAQAVSGDICAVHPDGHALTDYYFVECKHLASLDLTAALLRGKGALVQDWTKCARQAKHHEKFPLMIAKQNLYQPVVCLPIGHGLFEGPSMVLTKHHCVVYLLSYILSRRYVIPRLERQ